MCIQNNLNFLFYSLQATGSQIGVIVNGLSAIITALAIAFSYGWKLAFVVAGFMPFIVLSGLMQARLMSGSARRDKDSLEDASRVCIIRYQFIMISNLVFNVSLL